MTEKIFSITKENGILMARLGKQITNINELDELIDKLKESVRSISAARENLYNGWSSTIAWMDDLN